MDSTVRLITECFEANALGEQVATEHICEVFCSVQSVSGEEWERAARNDLQAVWRLVMPAINYSGQKLVEYLGARYFVYRVYQPGDSDDVELYLEQKAGAL